MASYQTRGRDPLFDSNTQAALEKRTKELGGLVMVGAGLALAMLLWSYSPNDPNWMLATDAPVQNWLGRFGASIAHPVTMIVGRGGWVLSLVLLVWGARWLLHRGEERIGRLVFAPIAIAMTAIYFSTLTPDADWVHKFGLGGLFGDTVLSLILTILPVGLGIGVKLLSVGLAIVSLIAVAFCSGVTKEETRGLRGLLKVGSVWLYEKVLGMAGSSAHISARAAGGLQARMADRLAERRERQAAQRAEAAAEAQAARISRSTAVDDYHDSAPLAAPPRLGAQPMAARPAQAARVAPGVTATAPVMPTAAAAPRKMVVRAGQAAMPAAPMPPVQPSLPQMDAHRLPEEDDAVFEDDAYWPTPAISAAEVASRVAGRAAGLPPQEAEIPAGPAPTLSAPSRAAQREIYGAYEPARPAPRGGLFSKVPNLLRRGAKQEAEDFDEYVEAYEGEVPADDRIRARIEDAIRLRGAAQPEATTAAGRVGPRPLILDSARPAAPRALRNDEPPLTAAIAAAVAHASVHPAQTPRAMFPVPPPPPVAPYESAPEPVAHIRVEPVMQAPMQPVMEEQAPVAPQPAPRNTRGFVPSGELVADATPTEFYGSEMRQKTRVRAEPRLSAAPKPVVPSQVDAPVAALESFLAAPVTQSGMQAGAQLAARTATAAGARAVQQAAQGVAVAASVIPAVTRVASALVAAPASAARNYGRAPARIEPTLGAPLASPQLATAPVPPVPMQPVAEPAPRVAPQAAPVISPVMAPRAPQPAPSYEQIAGDIEDVVSRLYDEDDAFDPAEIDAPTAYDAAGYDAGYAYEDEAEEAPAPRAAAPAYVAPVAAPIAAPRAPLAAEPRLAVDPRRGPAQALNRKAIQSAPPAPQPNRFENYEFPPLDLLMDPMDVERQHLSDEALEENARLLENVLDDYGVKGEIVSVRPGPVVTMYELEPAPGLKASRVIGLADDIARSMSALSARVSTVPGRSVIGIELPNNFREKVVLREIIAARDFGDSQMRLPLALGKDIAGEPIVANLAKMPHLLIAGTTGSGKSVAINTMILSLLYKLTPEECRLIMIDPKMLELSVYDGIPHLLSPVVTDPKKAVVALKWVVGEMEERYRKMSKMGVRNIEGYNGRVRDALGAGETFSRTVQTGFDEETGDPIWETEETTPELLPYIVVVVDEMADLMMVAGKEIEACIQRLAQMARASGIHLIMATQRPSVDVITGTIKANFPTRISFQVTSKIDSRTILGEQGAEQLLGMGDMLYMAGGGRVTRIHGPFCSDGEVEEIVSFLKSYGPPDYKSGVTDGPDDDRADDIDAVLGLTSTGGSSGNEAEDAMYDMAVQIVARDRKCSTSYIQRKLAIGYNKAARLVEQMETNGVVSAANAVGKREILVPEVH